jgi:hypothetical protein
MKSTTPHLLRKQELQILKQMENLTQTSVADPDPLVSGTDPDPSIIKQK